MAMFSDRIVKPALPATLVLLALFLMGIVAGGRREFDGWFGVEAYRAVGILAFLVSAGALLLLFAPGVAGSLSRFPLRIPRPVGILLLVGLSTTAFVVLTSVRVSGDAWSVLYQVGTGKRTYVGVWIHRVTRLQIGKCLVHFFGEPFQY